MSKTKYLLVLVGLLSALFFLPRPDGVRLAATQAGSLLLEPAKAGLYDASVESVDLAGAAAVQSFGEALVQSPAVQRGADGNWTLHVRGYRMDLSRTAWKDARLHARMLESIGRSLRAIGAEQGVEVSIEQRTTKEYPGVVLFCVPLEDSLLLEATLPDGSSIHAHRPWKPAGPVTVLPSLLAVGVALLLRKPLLALGLGALLGAMLERGMYGGSWLASGLAGSARLVGHYGMGELLDPTRAQILVFLVLMLAMVGVIGRAGGLRGLVEGLSRVAGSAKRSQVATFGMGLLIFFDHCANAMLVGSTMRSVTDRFRVSREKLAYLVDSTAAPVAGLSIFSTWIAFEVSAFSPQLPEAGLAASQGYEVFLRTLPFRFYSLFTLILVGLVVFTGRDFGPMLRAERRARAGGLVRPGAKVQELQTQDRRTSTLPARAHTALIPLGVFLGVTCLAILVRGGVFQAGGLGALFSLEGLSKAIYRGSGTGALVMGAGMGFATALVLAASKGLGKGVLSASWAGVRSAGPALLLLVLAWMIGAVCRDLGTAAYLSVILQDALNPLLLPILLFAVAGGIAFATGSSWSTMTILLPLVVGLAFDLGKSTPIGGVGMMVVCIASILEGAIFGDHCSPISDTTVLSSVAAGSDHVDHVRTQAPYAILAMSVAVVVGFFPTVIVGLSPWLSLALGSVVLAGFLRFYGRRAEIPAPAVEAEPGEQRLAA